MEVIVKKWGNSAAVRIPAAVMETAKLALEQPVDIRAEDGRVVIEPINKKEYDIGQLVAGISTENSHSSVDFGKPEGNEVW
ncbi:MAG: AbrB/MazE/SpoVT family DNA-binding domain-containing protein [Burkholderiales bacterium]|nr:AbrB/MazE/SpoVT family DNA-binding domain-containing protein [Burkholderiales bacterium]